MKKFVLTGGPCTGKTTVLKQLKTIGYATIPEIARAIIGEEQKKAKENPEYTAILPWTNLEEFEKLSWKRQIAVEAKANGVEGFQDRGLVDILTYCDLGDVHVDDDVEERIREAAYSKIFFLEQIPYQKDEERVEDPEEARRIHERMYEFYDEFGFDIVRVPLLEPKERLELILSNIREDKNREKEGKFKTTHENVKRALDSYLTITGGTRTEENTLYDLFKILDKTGCIFRLRKSGDSYKITFKGPDRGTMFTDKLELERSLSKKAYHFLRAVLPESGSYDKIRSNFSPYGDPQCTISLDSVKGLGEFVEIEAGSENQIELWKKRLQIEGEAIRQSYSELIKEI